jgi:hypothetical protein
VPQALVHELVDSVIMNRQTFRMPRPLQVYVDELDLQRLEAWSKKRGCTKSQAVRMALRALTRAEERDPLLAASGMIQGLPSDLSVNVDRALEESFVAPPSAQAKKSRASRRLRRH